MDAKNFPDRIRKRFRTYAISSTFFGCVSEQLYDSNSLIILYLMMLGGGESLSMFFTSSRSLATILFLLPAAAIIGMTGVKKAYSLGCYVMTACFIMIGVAPLFGGNARLIVLLGSLGYCLSSVLYGGSWYPILDTFLRPEERSNFFGTMRFSYMILNTALIFLLGMLLGNKPPLWQMQLIFIGAGLLILGRKWFMDRLPHPPKETNSINIKSALTISIRNGPLVGFAFYLCFLNLAATPMLPLAIIYMKSTLQFGAKTILVITSIGLVGNICGYALVGKMTKKLGIKGFQIFAHSMYVLTAAILCGVIPGFRFNPLLLGGAAFCNGFAGAFSLCLFSTEMLALARPGNKTMAMAFCSTINALGSAGGRLISTLILGAGILQEQWSFAGVLMSKFNFLFQVSLLMLIFFYLLMLLSPSVVPKHDDYYHP